MDKRINVNGTECIVKVFVPDQRGYNGKPEVLADKMCDDFLNKHPELEECSREITYQEYGIIIAGFSETRHVKYAVCLYKVK